MTKKLSNKVAIVTGGARDIEKLLLKHWLEMVPKLFLLIKMKKMAKKQNQKLLNNLMIKILFF